jgi:hypothetical protein
MELVTIAVLVGIALGLRYKVFVPVPAITIAAMFSIVVGVGRADGIWSIVLMTAAVVSTFQIGYLAGIVIRAVIEEIFPSREGNGDSDQNLSMPFGQPGFLGQAAALGLDGEGRADPGQVGR